MILFALGFIAGAGISIAACAFAFREQEIIREIVKGNVPLQQAQQAFDSPEIIEPEEPWVRAAEEVIKENEVKGQDTKLSEL